MGKRETIELKAYNLLGKPYVWGGESDAEGGYDCSGFLYTVLNDAGIKVGRTTAQGYYNKFSSKSKYYNVNSAKCGDLLFFGSSPKNIKHVAIAKDNRTMFESIGSSKNTRRNPGKGVCISDIKRRNDLVAIIDIFDDDEPYYPRYTGKSLKIDIVFQAIGAPYGNVQKRTSTAIHNGIIAYKGTAKQNLTLISLAKEGRLFK